MILNTAVEKSRKKLTFKIDMPGKNCQQNLSKFGQNISYLSPGRIWREAVSIKNMLKLGLHDDLCGEIWTLNQVETI